MSDGHRARVNRSAEVVATLDLNTRRVAVRSIAWLGDWLLKITDMVKCVSDDVENARIIRADEIVATINGLDDNPWFDGVRLKCAEHAIDHLRDVLGKLPQPLTCNCDGTIEAPELSR